MDPDFSMVTLNREKEREREREREKGRGREIGGERKKRREKKRREKKRSMPSKFGQKVSFNLGFCGQHYNSQETIKGCASAQPGSKTNRQTWNPGNKGFNTNMREAPG